jgi:hypothetical protein
MPKERKRIPKKTKKGGDKKSLSAQIYFKKLIVFSPVKILISQF